MAIMDQLPNILTQVIPHSCQTYDTAGDYMEQQKMWIVRVSKLGNWKYEFLVLLHELMEMALTKERGIDWKDIDHFDKVGEGAEHPDPGTLPLAPYHREHILATDIEKLAADMLGVDWEKYEQSFEHLEYKPVTD